MLMFRVVVRPAGGLKAPLGALALVLLCIASQDARADRLQESDHAEVAAAVLNVDEDEAQRRITFDGTVVAALAASLLISALANSAGVGGGALLVPLFHVVLSFSVKMSTALSQAAIASGAAGSAAYALTRRHPLHRKQPLVDFDIALMFTPLLLLGVSAGVLLNVLFPPVLLSICLLAMLVYLTVRTAATGIRMRHMEARLQGLHRRFSSGNGSGGGGISSQQGNAAQVVFQLEEEEEGEEDEGQGEESWREARPLLGGGTGMPPAADSGGRGCRSGSSSAPPSAVGTPRAPGSSGRSLLSGLRIVGRWRGGSGEAEGSGAAGSLGSDGCGSFEDAIGSNGSRGGLLPREVSMQCVSNLQARQQASCEEPDSAGDTGQAGVQQFSSPSGDHHQRQQQQGQQQQGQQQQRQQQQRQQEQQQEQPPLDDQQADGTVTVSVAQHSSLAPTPLKLPLPPLASPTRSPVRLALRQQLWEQQQGWRQQGSHPATPSAASPGGQAAQEAAFSAGIHHGEPQSELEERRFPWLAVGQLVALWAIFLAFQLAKAPLSSASWKFAALYLAQSVASVAASAVFARQVLERQKQRLQLAQGLASGTLEQPMLAAASPANSPTSARAASSPTQFAQGPAPLPWQHQQGHQQQQQQQQAPHLGESSTAAAPYAGSTGSSDWTQQKIVRVMGVVVAGGALAGLLGIGGGMVIGPLLLGMHIHPQASSATSGVMVLFSASVAAVSFAAAGRLNLEYAAAFGAACFAAAFLGVLVVGGMVRRSGRASIIVLILAFMIGLGGVLTAASLIEGLLSVL